MHVETPGIEDYTQFVVIATSKDYLVFSVAVYKCHWIELFSR